MTAKPGFIDAHCHLADARLDPVRDSLLTRAADCGITHFLQGGVDPADWARQRRLNHSGVWRAFGLHPWFVAENTEQTCTDAFDHLRDQLADAVALGELGLDYGPRCETASRARQGHFFRAQLELAHTTGKPLVLHVVRAHGEALQLLRTVAPRWRGLVHAFSGSREVAADYIRLGLCVSLGPALLRPGFRKVKEAVSHIPRDHLVVESDAPDGPPLEEGRAFNEPTVILRVAEVIAASHGVTAAEVLTGSRDNLLRAFAPA